MDLRQVVILWMNGECSEDHPGRHVRKWQFLIRWDGSFIPQAVLLLCRYALKWNDPPAIFLAYGKEPVQSLDYFFVVFIPCFDQFLKENSVVIRHVLITENSPDIPFHGLA